MCLINFAKSITTKGLGQYHWVMRVKICQRKINVTYCNVIYSSTLILDYFIIYNKERKAK